MVRCLATGGPGCFPQGGQSGGREEVHPAEQGHHAFPGCHAPAQGACGGGASDIGRPEQCHLGQV
eukprot:4669831-Heterocapsa_arctica.AAC.1